MENKICLNCGNDFVATKGQKYCSMKCRIVPPGMVLDGQTFGWITVIRETDPGYKKSGCPYRRFECVCKCGNTCIKAYDNIKNKVLVNPSCGCFMSYHATNRLKHGMTKTAIYHVWAALKHRCYKKSHPSYKDYGAKGVKVCDRWKEYNNFYEDMGATYKEGLTLDRIDWTGNYEPLNCRWTTYKVQNRNKSNNIFCKVRGYKKCVSEFAEVLNFPKATMYYRLNKRKWSEEESVLGKDKEQAELNYQKIKLFYEHKSS